MLLNLKYQNLHLNPFYYLFYIIYKFVKLTTKKELQDQVPSAALAGIFIGLTNNYVALILYTKITHHFESDIFSSVVIFSLFPILIYFLCRRLLIRDEKYISIEVHFDEKNKLSKIHFIFISTLYLVGSIGLMIWSGVNSN